MINASHLKQSRPAEQVTSEKLIRDVRVVVHGAEELIRATAGDVGEKTREARARLAGALVVTRDTCNRLEENLMGRARSMDALIRSHPYQCLGMALAVGILSGWLGRRR
jgi:ElaB/YqjD/DUF883 family membrane-anchored ribosome-binding protein